MKNRMMKFIMSHDIGLLALFSYLIPLALLIIWALIAENIFNGHIPQSVHMLVVLLCMPIAGLGGLFQVIKKETPGVMGKNIKGGWAIASGILIMILVWGLCAVIWYLYIVEYVIGK